MLDLGSLVWISFNPQVKYSNQEEFSWLTSFLHVEFLCQERGFPGGGRRQSFSHSFGNRE